VPERAIPPALERALVALVLGAASQWVALPEAAAVERELATGVDVGYALGGFPDASVSGFGAGAHLGYGVSDAFNLRLSGDVSAFDLPEPGQSALLYSVLFGAEYVIDVLEWVPYIGAASGVSVMSLQNGPNVVHLAIDIPGGLGYRLSSFLTLGVEARYRLLLFGSEVSPTSGLALLGRFDYVFDLGSSAGAPTRTGLSLPR
jgi:hypothetical protein